MWRPHPSRSQGHSYSYSQSYSHSQSQSQSQSQNRGRERQSEREPEPERPFSSFSSSRAAGTAHHFTIPQEDFEAQSLLKRRRVDSPRTSGNGAAVGTTNFRRRTRSSSKARDAVLKRLPSQRGQEFIALGRSDASIGINTGIGVARRSAATSGEFSMRIRRSASRDRESEKERGRGRERERAREKEKEKERERERERARLREEERQRQQELEREREELERKTRSSGKARRTRQSEDEEEDGDPEPSRPQLLRRSSSIVDDDELDRSCARTDAELREAQAELRALQTQLRSLQTRVDAKTTEVQELEIVLGAYKKRKELRSASRSRPAPAPASGSEPRSEPERPAHRPKRPCIVDEEDEDEDDDDDDDVVLVGVKREVREEEGGGRARDAPTPMPVPPSRRVSPDRETEVETETAYPAASSRRETSTSNGSKSKSKSTRVPDHFWGCVDVPKLLGQHRIQYYADTHGRKVRHLAFNPEKPDVVATSADDGGLVLWSYSRHTQSLAKVVAFDPLSFRDENCCAESIAWSPDGYRLAMAFRDPNARNGNNEFCIARLHQLELEESRDLQKLPKDRLQTVATGKEGRGVSAIEWIASGTGEAADCRGLVTADPTHAVVLWEERPSGKMKTRSQFQSTVLHTDHRSDVRSICHHSSERSIFTSGLDGLVIRYDVNAMRTEPILERRATGNIAKINAVLEHPHNPNLLLFSCLDQSGQNLLLHDLRDREPAMTLTCTRAHNGRSLSQYVLPRWAPAGMHVSCGSPSGVVHIWDVRVRGPHFPDTAPQQSIQVHQKQVLYATWHPRYDTMVTISSERQIGLLTFR